MFDPRVLKAKKRLCRAFEALMTLSSPAAIRAQWEEIDTLWRAWWDTEKQVRKQVEQAMRRKTPKGGSR
ncbi:hypothetical protein [Thiobacter aerophilum]|uniref:Uncharacterized protein n=1 Tax=Thiobacter aerophilum TaxID=3121275 RepID=A0ABV0EKV8_9BURK